MGSNVSKLSSPVPATCASAKQIQMLGLEKLSGVEGADQHLSLIPALSSATTGPEPQTLTGTFQRSKK